MSAPYRVDGYTMWYRVVVTEGEKSGFGCCRCLRPAQFSRVVYKRRKGGGESYAATGYCAVHLPKTAPENFQITKATPQ